MSNALNSTVIGAGLVKQGKVYELGCVFEPGMTHYPLHPPFTYAMVRGHGELASKHNTTTTASDMFSFGAHTGTHIDALGHVGSDGKLFDGSDALTAQSDTAGLLTLGIERNSSVVSRGILLDIPALKGVEVLEAAYVITKDDMLAACEKENVEIREGDTVLIRTGWMKYWNDTVKFNSLRKGTPGPDPDAARWLASKKIRATGTDTMAYEVVPNNGTPVHVILLKENGIQIMEMLDMEKLSEDKIYEFMFVAAALRIRGGTGSPINPLAII